MYVCMQLLAMHAIISFFSFNHSTTRNLCITAIKIIKQFPAAHAENATPDVQIKFLLKKLICR